MSSGQKPRNPRYFPNMKVRGVRRRRLAPFQAMTRAFDGLAMSARQASEAVETMWKFSLGD